MQLARWKLCKKIHPDHGGHRHPTAAMPPHSRRRGKQQSANILRSKFMLLKRGLVIVININLTIHRSTLTSIVGCVLFFLHRNTLVLYQTISDMKSSAEVAATMAAPVVPWRPGPGAKAKNN